MRGLYQSLEAALKPLAEVAAADQLRGRRPPRHRLLLWRASLQATELKAVPPAWLPLWLASAWRPAQKEHRPGYPSPCGPREGCHGARRCAASWRPSGWQSQEGPGPACPSEEASPARAPGDGRRLLARLLPGADRAPTPKTPGLEAAAEAAALQRPTWGPGQPTRRWAGGFEKNEHACIVEGVLGFRIFLPVWY